MLTPTGFVPLREHSIDSTIEEMLSRAKALYTLPSVAAEVLQLTSNPSVEPRAIKECIQRDPALTAKILRVVNSSLFGFAGRVNDLNQAIALLGIKPLKILVLGFSLPDNLFADVARDQLRWYWTNTLTRAVAAREISERLFKTPGDEAFLAGLLQGLGVLMLARQLGPTYANLLRSAIDTGVELRRIERDALGFDHLTLTLAMLRSWNMPRQLTDAIASQEDPRQLAREHRLNNTVDRVLHLANLTAELVGQHRLSVLPDLLEAGDAYCQLDRQGLHDLIISLQPKVNQLADVLSLEVGDGQNFEHILKSAHELMSELAESAFGSSPRPEELEPPTPMAVLEAASELRYAMNLFLSRSAELEPVGPSVQKAFSRFEAPSKHSSTNASPGPATCSEQFVEWLTLVAANCRSRRESLSVLMLQVHDTSSRLEAGERLVSHALESAGRDLLPGNTLTDKGGPGRRTIVLPGVDRQEAVRLGHDLIRAIEQERLTGGSVETCHVVSVGVASASVPSRNFVPFDILTAAERCLAAARSLETSAVKSLEIH